MMMEIMNRVGRLGAGKEGGRDTAGGNSKSDSPAGTNSGKDGAGRSCMYPLGPPTKTKPRLA